MSYKIIYKCADCDREVERWANGKAICPVCLETTPELEMTSQRIEE
jgi:predicted amidophosphoribosyltransferase